MRPHVPISIVLPAVLSLFGAVAYAQVAPPPPFAGFDPPVFYPTGFVPAGLRARDLTGDGFPDIATANEQSDDASILVNRGDGTFFPEIRIPVANAPRDIEIADFNGDGIADLAVVLGGEFHPRGLAVLLATAPAQFAAPVFYASGSAPVSMAAGDLDGDGDIDLVTANQGSDDMAVHLNTGAGAFAPAVLYAAGRVPQDVKLGDLDGDGDLDAVVGIAFDTHFTVLWNRGDGSFEGPQFVPTAEKPFQLAVADFDADGRDDVLIRSPAKHLTVFVSIGGRRFTEHGPFPTGALMSEQEAGRIDPNGAIDEGFIRGGGVPPPFGGSLLGDGAGNLLQPPIGIELGTSLGFPMAIADLDLDGDNDVVAGRSFDVSVAINRAFRPDAPDLNGDGVVDGADVAMLLQAWGGAGPTDLDHSGVTNGADLARLLNNFGRSFPAQRAPGSPPSPPTQGETP